MGNNFENNNNLLIPVKSFQQICRTCLVVDKLIDIKNVNVEGTNLLDVISASIQFENSPELPQNMCMNCIRKFYKVNRFLKECIQTQVFLQNIISNQNTIKVDEEEVSLVHPTELKDQANEYCDKRSDGSMMDTIVTETQEILMEKDKTSNRVVVDAFVLDSQKLPTEQENEIALDLPENFESDCFQETILKFLKLDKVGMDIEKSETDKKITGTTPNKFEIPKEKNKTNDGVLETIVFKTQEMPTNGVVDTTTMNTREIPTEKDRNRIASDLPENFEIENFQETVLKFLKLDENPETMTNIIHHGPKKLACKFCGRQFNTKYYCIQHMRTHTGEKPFSCNICKKCFGEKSTYRRHLLMHSGSKKYLCSVCGKGFIRIEQLGNHERIHHEVEKLLCTFCGKEFTNYGLFCKHKREKHLNKEIKLDPSIPFQCKTCGKIYANEKLLQEHEDNHLKKKQQNPLNNECEHCQTKFADKSQLRFHLLDSECTKFVTLFPCSECNAVSVSKKSWKVHKILHAEEKRNERYICEICRKVFDKITYYRSHCREHTKDRKFMCSFCGLCFKAERHLTTHLRTHTGEKPYICQVCNKAFSFKGNLKKHKLIHSDLKPYKCDTCESEFRDFYDLKKHVKLRHPYKLSDFIEQAQNIVS